jgi:hypothetical protein
MIYNAIGVTPPPAGRTGLQHGLRHESIVNFDTTTTVHRDRLGARLGFLGDDEDEAVLLAFQEASAHPPSH